MIPITSPDQFPKTPHYLVVIFRTVIDIDSCDEVSAPEILMTEDSKEWVDFITKIEENPAVYGPYSALVVKGKGTVKKRFEVSVTVENH